MAHLGIICPALSGHLNPMMTLCRELQRRGHQITFYQVIDGEPKVRAGGFNVRTYGEEHFPPGSIARDSRRLGELTGKEALNFTREWFRKSMQVNLAGIPPLARADRVEAFLVDQVTWEGGTVAEELSVPYVTVSNAMMLNAGKGIPPFFTTWPQAKGPVSRLKNFVTWQAYARLLKPNLAVLNDYRVQRGLRPIRNRVETVSRLAQISQQPKEFEFPRSDLPPHVHFAGPFQDETVRPPAPFPYEKLTGAPLVYASMGTLQNRQGEIFGCIAEACANLPVQLVISLGGGSKPDSLPGLKGNPLVLEFVPQLELLKKARLCITHAGLNTVLESLANGVPMVAIPITNDQPGVAARLAWSGAGEFIPAKELTPARLRAAITRVLEDPKYSRRAADLQAAIRWSGGAKRAAGLIEQALASSGRS